MISIHKEEFGVAIGAIVVGLIVAAAVAWFAFMHGTSTSGGGYCGPTLVASGVIGPSMTGDRRQCAAVGHGQHR